MSTSRATPRDAHLLSWMLLALLSFAPVRAAAVDVAELGSLEFPNSGATEAQEPFLRGVLLLHSFEYEDARDEFRRAQEIDPDFALAYWGEAMTHNHPLWDEQDREAARAALERLAPTRQERLAKAGSDRERGYLEAVEALYGDGDKGDRDRDYEEAMRRLAEAHPDDHEARAFYALSILGTTEGRRDFRTFMRAGATAEEVFAANPRHPGALHYMIHSYDDPVHAPLGLRAARIYADVAPAASHAQHMISHIFVALGRWDESVESNRKAFEVSRERAERKGLGVDKLNYHALQWLAYSYLQLGRWDDARRLLDDMEGYATESDSSRARWYHAAMRAAWVVETGGRDAPGGHGLRSTELAAQVLDLFADGYAAWAAGETEAAAEALAELQERIDDAAAEDAGEEPADDRRVDERVLARSLRALLEMEAGNQAVALALLDEATAAEAALPLEYGPPDIVKPSHELYGEVLLGLGRPEAARARFETALDRAPRRSLSLAGLAEAARAQGDTVLFERTCGELAEIRAGSEAGLPKACGG